ncbi:hypothetical protein D3C76_427530 [compost metagenome]
MPKYNILGLSRDNGRQEAILESFSWRLSSPPFQIRHRGWTLCAIADTFRLPLPRTHCCLERDFHACWATARCFTLARQVSWGGDSDRSRLYGYRYPSGRHGRLITSKAAQLLAIGHMITFHWAVVEDQDTSRRIEAALLQMHLDEHLEFPPFNGKS